jgi:hypothetical protein
MRGVRLGLDLAAAHIREEHRLDEVARAIPLLPFPTAPADVYRNDPVITEELVIAFRNAAIGPQQKYLFTWEQCSPALKARWYQDTRNFLTIYHNRNEEN